MANNKDFEIEDMENSAIRKRDKFKRAAVAGAAIAGVAGTTAYGAEKISQLNDTEAPGENAMMDAANAGAVDSEVLGAQETAAAAAATSQEVHVHHYLHEEDPTPGVSHPAPNQNVEPEIKIDESTVLYDEEGNRVMSYDEGTIDGKSFVVIDSDNNGRGDMLAYDANGNQVIDEGELIDLDNQSYVMGQGEHQTAYIVGGENPSDPMPRMNPADDLADIHNDFDDEKTGEQYGGDLADNNPDYVNDEYYAGVEEKYDESATGSDLAFDETDSYDDPSQYDIV